MNPNTHIFVGKKVAVLKELQSCSAEWLVNLEESFGVDTVKPTFNEETCCVSYEDAKVAFYEKIDIIENEEEQTRYTTQIELQKEMREIQKTFRKQLFVLTENMLTKYIRDIQKVCTEKELEDKQKIILEIMNSTCPITQSPIVYPVKSPCCKTLFNKGAFDKWIAKEFSCPNCRKPIKKEKEEYVLLEKPIEKKIEEELFSLPCCGTRLPFAVAQQGVQMNNGYCPCCGCDLLLMSTFLSLIPQTTQRQ